YDESKCAPGCGSASGISGSRSVRCCPATSSITTCCGSSIPAYCAAREALHTPMAISIGNTSRAQKSGQITDVSWSVDSVERNRNSRSIASEKGCRLNRSRYVAGCSTNAEERKAVNTPTSEPNVPG